MTGSNSVRLLVKKFDYSLAVIPTDYKCGHCGVVSCKLCREFNSPSSFIVLRCTSCAEVNQRRMHEAGWQSLFSQQCDDQIGVFIPAVPKEDGLSYWSYIKIPQAGLDWWNKLPILPNSSSA